MSARRRQRGHRGATPVRVIAGSLKGRVLAYPPGREVRPTMQRTRAALFDSLGHRIGGALFVDLFAAAGGVGIEAASRGAAFVHFVEKNRRALDALHVNLERCGLGGDSCDVHAADVFAFLEASRPSDFAGAIFFADPPYAGGSAAEVLESLAANGYHEIALLLLEHEGELRYGSGLPFELVNTIRSGQTSVSCFIPTEG